MKPTSRDASSHAYLSSRLTGLALVGLLAGALGCGDGAEPQGDVSPPPASAAPPHQTVELQPLGPIEPPNPATHRPPTDNPGGLNRFRPARPVPGLN